MLHTDDKRVKELLFDGMFGLEKESLRIDENGFFAHSAHPFPGESHITRDFSENQTEINTSPVSTPEEAISELIRYSARIASVLDALPEKELIWPFSNPPYIRSEEDIPIAQFYGDEASKTSYREYLSDRYGRYKMTFSGIHFNYSFSEELLKANFALDGGDDFGRYKDLFYTRLAERAMVYGWVITALTAASPLMDSSYVLKDIMDYDLANGMASTRCSELGYWNYFVPVFDYCDIQHYADSIQKYVDDGSIRFMSELYYPIRVKPNGAYSIEGLKNKGVSHIELRMIDLNPLELAGLDVRDVRFCQLFLIWLASSEGRKVSVKDQQQAVQNFKNAAHFDLETVKILHPSGCVMTVREAGLRILASMKELFSDAPDEIKECLLFEESKMKRRENRYAYKVYMEYSGGFVKKGLELARKRQAEFLAIHKDLQIDSGTENK